jgi:hypothetical protein
VPLPTAAAWLKAPKSPEQKPKSRNMQIIEELEAEPQWTGDDDDA